MAGSFWGKSRKTERKPLPQNFAGAHGSTHGWAWFQNRPFSRYSPGVWGYFRGLGGAGRQMRPLAGLRKPFWRNLASRDALRPPGAPGGSWGLAPGCSPRLARGCSPGGFAQFHLYRDFFNFRKFHEAHTNFTSNREISHDLSSKSALYRREILKISNGDRSIGLRRKPNGQKGYGDTLRTQKGV